VGERSEGLFSVMRPPGHRAQPGTAPYPEDLSRRVERVVPYPLSELYETQRREFHEALLEAAGFEDLPGKWQAAILKAEHNANGR
jgi:hypothetical protein